MKDRYSFDGKEHVHYLNGKPLHGTTTVLKVISKPLTWWASGLCAAEFGWLHHKKHDKVARARSASIMLGEFRKMKLQEYVAFLDKAYRAHDTYKESRADSGKDLHADVDAYVRYCITGKSKPRRLDPQLVPFAKWADRNVDRFLFSEVHCYSRVLRVGGIVDFAYKDKRGYLVLADNKSAPRAYFDNFAQLGGYDLQIQENGLFSASGKLLGKPEVTFSGHAIFNFGGGFTQPSISFEVTRNRRMFQAALLLHKDRQSFDAEFP